MIIRNAKLLLAAISTFFLSINFALAQPAEQSVVIPMDKVVKYAQGAVKAEKQSDLVYSLLDAKGKKLGKLLCTTPLADDVMGYADAVPVLLVLNNNDVIQGLVLLDNSETPAYLKKLEKADFLSSWNGKSIKQAKDAAVDAVSGATLTSNAVKENVVKAAEHYLTKQKK